MTDMPFEKPYVIDDQGNRVEVEFKAVGPTYIYEMFWCGHAYAGYDGWVRRLRLKIHNWTCRRQA